MTLQNNHVRRTEMDKGNSDVVQMQRNIPSLACVIDWSDVRQDGRTNVIGELGRM